MLQPGKITVVWEKLLCMILYFEQQQCKAVAADMAWPAMTNTKSASIFPSHAFAFSHFQTTFTPY